MVVLWGLGSAAALAVGGLTASEPLLATALTLALPLLMLCRSPEALTVLVGVSIPIYTIGDADPLLFDIGRLGVWAILTLVLVLRPQDERWGMPDFRWALLAFAMVAASLIHPSAPSVRTVVALVAGGLLGAQIGRRSETFAALSWGYRLGVLLSSVVLLSAVAGGPNLEAAVDQFSGHWGLSSRSTAFSYTAALALVLWRWQGPSGGSLAARLGHAVEAPIVATALVISGGRGGAVALAVAAVALPLVAGRLREFWLALALISVCVGLALLAGSHATAVSRLYVSGGGESTTFDDRYSSGRLTIYRDTFAEVSEHPLLGQGFTKSAERATGVQQYGHNVLLFFALAGGVPLAAAAALLYLQAAALAVRGTRREQPRAIAAAPAVLVIFIVNSLIEADGGLVGARGVVVFAAAYTAATMSAPLRKPWLSKPARDAGLPSAALAARVGIGRRLD